jgi:hypothetical protein
MSKELKIGGNFGKDFQQIYVGDEPTNIFINNEGKIKSANFDSDLNSAMSIDIDRTNPLSSKLELSDDLCVLKSKQSITLHSRTGRFNMINGGIEFSPANSAYAGMILGYTRIANDSTTSGHQYITINSSAMTVLQTGQGTDLSVTFTAPPSGKVEINFSCWMSAITGGAKFSLSTASSYSELDETHTYDADQNVYIDESDHYIHNVNFSVSGLTAGTSYTYYIAGRASEANVLIIHGRNRTFGTFYPPIIIKAIALPQSITTGE